jgi:ParB/RepB/Spo0J family partition protein
MTSQPITELVLQTEAILRLAASSSYPIKAADVVAATGLDAGSARRDLRRLRDAGLLVDDGEGAKGAALYARTFDTLDVVAALDRAANPDGAVTGMPVWPLDRIQFNPDNPRKSVSQIFIDGLADTIVEAGGLLQAIILYPSDASGARMLHAGEQRVRACQQLVEEGRLPASLAEGLPYTEREATRAEALFIGLVENSQREGLSPWEDAKALKAYADETGLSARAIAFKLGRAREGAETGVRDVQDKIRIATKATALEIAKYLAGGKWEDLRDSIREAQKLSPHAALAMAELRWKVEETGRHPDDDVDQCWVLSDGQGDRWASHRELTRASLIDSKAQLLEGILSPLVRITEAGLAWIGKAMPADATGLAAGLDDKALDYVRTGFGQMEGDGPTPELDQGYTTPWLNARALQEQIDRRRSGLPDRDPAQLDIEEAIAGGGAKDTPKYLFTPAQDLALVELKARIERKQIVAYGRARLFYPEPAWVERLHHDLFAPMGDSTHQPRRVYLGLTRKADAYLRDAGLWVDGQNIDDLIRLARAKRDAWTPRALALGQFATDWLDFRGMNSQAGSDMSAKSATKPPAILDTPTPKPMTLSAKQKLLLAELADFLWHFPNEDILPPGPHGGAHGLDGLGCVKFEGLVGLAAPKRVRITETGRTALRAYALDQLLDGASGEMERRHLLFAQRVAVISEDKAVALAEGEYATPWLNTDAAQDFVRKAREQREGQTKAARHKEPAARALEMLRDRIAGIQELSIMRREGDDKPPLHTEPMKDLANQAIFELTHGAPFVAVHLLAAMYLKTQDEKLGMSAVETEFRWALERRDAQRDAGRGEAGSKTSDALLTLNAGDVVNTGGATDYRLISRKDRQDSGVFDFVVQPILKGKDYGGKRALNLSEIRSLVGHGSVEAAEASPAADAEEDPERDAVNEDEYRGWIADILATNHQADPEAAPGFAIEAFDQQNGNGLGIKFLETPGTWRRADAAFDAADWATENLVNGLRIEPDQSQTEGEDDDVAAA